MGEEAAAVIDTYALMAEATDEVTEKAEKYLQAVRRGEIKGIIHPLIAYEFLLQYYRGRLPAFKSLDEPIDFLKTYFVTKPISDGLSDQAASIKNRGRRIEQRLKRILSACDALTIALAKQLGSPIVTGDEDLRSVAENEKVNVVW